MILESLWLEEIFKISKAFWGKISQTFKNQLSLQGVAEVSCMELCGVGILIPRK